MTDIKKTRQRLWSSLDMSWVRTQFWITAAACAVFWLFCGARYDEAPWIRPLIVGVVAAPILLFLLWRTWKIFRRAEGYIFCQTVLDSPAGGWRRGTIYFTVTVTDSGNRRYRVDTHPIFYTRSMFGNGLQDYVNRKVTVAYNEETGTLVVIG